MTGSFDDAYAVTSLTIFFQRIFINRSAVVWNNVKDIVNLDASLAYLHSSCINV